MKLLYGIRDRVAMAMTGGHVHVFGHDTVAIRFFHDVCSAPDTIISRHIDDFELVCLGTMEDDGSLGPDTKTNDFESFVPRIVMTGTAWKALQAEALK